jgi:hypothetical protein
MSMRQLELWDLWYPFAGATGVPFARGRLDSTNLMWVHAAPEALTVEIRSDDGRLLARGQDLLRTTPDGLPMTKLTRIGERVVREDLWPSADAVGSTVILPGGEVGIIKSWWHAPDYSEWRWVVEFYNHR